jgi:hypothetical protein
MKGHIRERSPGHWAIILDVPGDDGNRRRKWHSFKGTKREAQAECARLITEMKAGAYVEQHRQTLNDFLDHWEREWAARNVSPKTNERYSELLRTHVRPHIGAKPIQSIRVEDLNRLYSDLHQKIAPRTVKHIHRLLHRVLGHATKWGRVKRNVVALVDAPKVQVVRVGFGSKSRSRRAGGAPYRCRRPWLPNSEATGRISRSNVWPSGSGRRPATPWCFRPGTADHGNRESSRTNFRRQ